MPERVRPRVGLLLWIVVFLSLFLLGYLLYDPLVRVFYPVPYREAVDSYARAYGLDPFLLTAVMKVESGFDAEAVSSRGARGLMQIMPETAAWAATHLGMEDFGLDELFDPEVNLRIGAWYLAYLQQEFQGRIVPALAAYNGGRSNVRRWLDEVRWTGERETLGQIPFPETRQYVSRVLETHEAYRRVYGGEWEAARQEISWELGLRRLWRLLTAWTD